MAMTHATPAGAPSPASRPAPHELAAHLYDDIRDLFIDVSIARDLLGELDDRLNGGDDGFEQLVHMTWLNTRAAGDRLMVLEEQAAILVTTLAAPPE